MAFKLDKCNYFSFSKLCHPLTDNFFIFSPSTFLPPFFSKLIFQFLITWRKTGKSLEISLRGVNYVSAASNDNYSNPEF